MHPFSSMKTDSFIVGVDQQPNTSAKVYITANACPLNAVLINLPRSPVDGESYLAVLLTKSGTYGAAATARRERRRKAIPDGVEPTLLLHSFSLQSFLPAV
jgi:hypothetical protein